MKAKPKKAKPAAVPPYPQMTMYGPRVEQKDKEAACNSTRVKVVAANQPAALTTVQEEHDLGPLVPTGTSEAGENDDFVYTAAELMVLLKVGRSKIREMLRAREIRSMKIGSLVRVRRKDLEEYIERVASAR